MSIILGIDPALLRSAVAVCVVSAACVACGFQNEQQCRDKWAKAGLEAKEYLGDCLIRVQDRMWVREGNIKVGP